LQPIIPSKSAVTLSATKVEIKLQKADIGAWKDLEFTSDEKADKKDE